MANKAKVKKAAAKRFKQTATGYKARRANRSHILTKKSSKRKRHLKANNLVDTSDVRSVRRMLKHEG